MENKHSTSGIGEDIIRSFTQYGATEMHLKTLLEKTLAEMENGIIDVENPEAVEKQTEKLEAYKSMLIDIAQLRRKAMLYLFEMYEGDKDAWCLVKHLSIGAMTMFEAWQASDNDYELLTQAIEANRLLTMAVSMFIGTEISDCAACMSDYLKAKGE